MLKLIENSFSTSSLKVKLQLFLLPLFFIYFYIYFYSGNESQFIKNDNYKLDELLNKKFDKSYLILTKEIESYCDLKKIKIDSIDYKKKNLLIKGRASLSKIKSLIIKLETINNYSNINLLNILKTAKTSVYKFEINTEFKKYYIKNKRTKIDTINTNTNATLKPKLKPKDKFKLKAIVANHVLINSKWYMIDDKIGKYKITKISENDVLLKYEKKDLNLKLHKNE